MLDTDCSPKVGEKISNGAMLIAKRPSAHMTDQNNYIVLCLVQHNDTIRPFEYVTWTLMANGESYDTYWGHYWGDNLQMAVEDYYAR